MTWTEVSLDDTITGFKKYKFKSFYEKTSGDVSDSEVIAGICGNTTKSEIEDKLLKETGTPVTVKSMYGAVETPGKVYSYNVVLETGDVHSPTLLTVIAIIAFFSGINILAFLITSTYKHTTDKAYEAGGVPAGITTNAFYIIGGIIILYLLLKRR